MFEQLFFSLPFDGGTASFTGADGTLNSICFAAIWAFDDVWRRLVGWVDLRVVLLHDWSFADITAACGAVGARTGRMSHSKGLRDEIGDFS